MAYTVTLCGYTNAAVCWVAMLHNFLSFIRWDMTKSDHHWQHEKARTLDKIVQALTAKEKMGVKNPPLLDIPIDHFLFYCSQ